MTQYIVCSNDYKQVISKSRMLIDFTESIEASDLKVFEDEQTAKRFILAASLYPCAVAVKLPSSVM